MKYLVLLFIFASQVATARQTFHCLGPSDKPITDLLDIIVDQEHVIGRLKYSNGKSSSDELPFLEKAGDQYLYYKVPVYVRLTKNGGVVQKLTVQIEHNLVECFE